MEKTKIIKAICYLLGAIATAIMIMFGMESCTASRTITNTAEYRQQGDTTIIIQTKSVEKYDANKKQNNF